MQLGFRQTTGTNKDVRPGMATEGCMLERRDFATRPFATPMQKDHARLKAAWERVNRERLAQGKPKLLQKALAAEYGVTESNIGHYLKGREPLNDKWKLRFAKFLGLPVWEIWPDYEYRDVIAKGLPAGAIEFGLEYLDITEEGQQALRGIMKTLPRRQKPRTGTQ